MPFYDDDGREISEFEIEKPALCLICRKDDDPDQDVLCQLTRLDQQGEPEFRCYAYERKELL